MLMMFTLSSVTMVIYDRVTLVNLKKYTYLLFSFIFVNIIMGMSARLEELTKKINEFKNQIKEIEESGEDPHSLREEYARLLNEHKRLVDFGDVSRGLIKG